MTTAEPARCSFCSKSQDDVYVLIAGPAVFICDECVDLSNDILMEKQRPVRWLFVAAGRAWRISLRATLRALTFGLTPRRVSPGTDSTS